MRAHIGKKSYPCSQCDWHFLDNTTFINHLKKNFQFMWGRTLRRNHINVIYRTRFSQVIGILQNIWYCTLGRNNINITRAALTSTHVWWVRALVTKWGGVKGLLDQLYHSVGYLDQLYKFLSIWIIVSHFLITFW